MKDKSGKQPALARDLDAFLGDLCVQWGFCNELEARDLFEGNDTLEADAFARAVLIAEEMNPELEIQWMRKIRRLFIERYGADRVSAGSYEAGL